MSYQVLLDAPATPVSRIQVAALGDYRDKRYGDFAITRADVESWKTNLANLPGKRALIDLDHQADRQPRRTEAAGWITNIDFDGDKPVADVEWTSVGRQAIEDKRYLFFSPTYGPFKDERGNVHKNTLVGGALTNKPFLTSMPTLTLASDERVSEALDRDLGSRVLLTLDVDAAERKLALKEGNSLPDGSYPIRNTAQLHAAAILAASGHGNAADAKKLIKRRAKELGVDLKSLPGAPADNDDKKADSRRAMDTEILKALDLDSDADTGKVLEAIKSLKTADPDPEPTKTLEQLAADEGKIVLDSVKFTELSQDAKAGRHAAEELHATKFDTAFRRALDAGKALTSQKEQYEHFYKLDADGTLKMLDAAPRLVNTEPIGQTYSIDGSDVPHGQHPDSFLLDQKIKDKLKELGKGMDFYPQAYELVARDMEVAA